VNQDAQGGLHSSGNYIDNGYLASPNYPGKYFMDAECQWTLRVQRSQTLSITLFDFELDVKHDGHCQDFLSVTSSRNGTKFTDCGALGKQVIDVDDNVAVLSFRTSQTSLTQRGFILYFEGFSDVFNSEFFLYILKVCQTSLIQRLFHSIL